MTKIDELLAVPELPEEAQNKWLYENAAKYGYDNHPAAYIVPCFKRAALFMKADLAFRLRDEANKKNRNHWLFACWYVLHKELNLELQVMRGVEAEAEILRRNPIWWIVTALSIPFITEELNKEKADED